MDVVYIDDVVGELIHALRGAAKRDADGYCSVPVHYETTLGHIAERVLSFLALRRGLEAPDCSDVLTKSSTRHI